MATFASIELSERATEEEEDDAPSTSVADKALGIEKSGPKQLGTNEISSIFNLKNELLKKKDTIRKTNLSGTHVRGKSNILVTKKDEREAREKEAAERDKRISANERAWKRREDEERLELAQQKLKDKAALYERLAEGKIVLENSDNTPVDFMVDFSSKKRQKEEEKRQRYEEAADAGPSVQTRDPIPERYHHSEEQRVFGVSHMRLSANEEKRKEEIQNLLDMSKQTKEQRLRDKIEQDELERKRREKVNALRKSKGLPPLKAPTPPPEPAEVDIDEIPLPIVSETPEERHIRLMKSDREWDRGKGLYTQWIEKQRDERDDEFRPPDSYYD